MTPPITNSLLVIFLLLGFSSFFSMAETALFSLSSQQVQKMIQSKVLGANLIKKFQSDPKQVLTAILLGNDLVNIAISILATEILVPYFKFLDKTLFFLISVGLTTFVILLFGEIVPKNIAIRAASLLAPLIVFPLQIFLVVTRPIRKVLVFIADRINLLFGVTIHGGRRMIMEEEFRALVTMGEGGGVDPLEKRLIDNLFKFSERKVGDLGHPREQIVSFPVETSLEAVLSVLKKRRFSRIPVYEGTKQNIIGVLYIKDLLTLQRDSGASGGSPSSGAPSGGTSFSLRRFLNPPLFIDPGLSVKDLLREFQSKKMHMALLKEQDNLVGLITMDDLLRYLLGVS
ncbi:MAG: HlyC/CorC family transporter [Deltaproteobacteria bacterium]|nr:HlyC/CorC family transporter [Deltaproteobacteria bacterium]